jgi:HK97 family phage prohead protease
MGIAVKGFAMPYDVANSYNEIIRHGAFTKWLGKFNASGRKLPMGFMHERGVGHWTKIEDRPEGLYVEGEITHPAAIEFFKDGRTRELSISFMQAKDADGTRRMSRERIESFKADGFSDPPPNIRAVELDDVTEAGLAEISLVDRGAFRGTHVEEA